ncbi:NAD-dependent histone deacetylase sir2 [Lunasporangiospora selenospora]|uniref:NAD-dependent histone deacetylase sir2 n=1 Tax=Lunasporangiospora selenospora TaxID=979761 RepID=A0A9P6KCK7_9FUNG|nr:NAD-dependent histone deacetylase sir2 [Lunasporangiospora selenospora]
MPQSSHQLQSQDSRTTTTIQNARLLPPADMAHHNSNRPDSPVTRKRTEDTDDDDSAFGWDEPNSASGSRSLPPTKRSKTSPPLLPKVTGLGGVADTDSCSHVHIAHSFDALTNTSDLFPSHGAILATEGPLLSPRALPLSDTLLNLATPTATLPLNTELFSTSQPTIAPTLSTSEKRYSPASAHDAMQSKSRKLDDGESTSTSSSNTTSISGNRPLSPPPLQGSPPFRARSPPFSRSATAILESFSKPGENSLDSLNLGTPILGSNNTVVERAMGVITTAGSAAGSRLTSPGPRTVATADIFSSSDNVKDDQDVDVAVMQTVSDEEEEEEDSFHESTIGDIFAGLQQVDDDSQEDNHDEDDDDSGKGDLMAHFKSDQHSLSGSDEEADYGGLISVDVDSDNDSSVGDQGEEGEDNVSEGSPFHDPDPLCQDLFTEEESNEILEEAIIHGAGYIVRNYIQTGLVSVKKLLLMIHPGKQLKIPARYTERELIFQFYTRMQKYIMSRRRLANVHSLEHVVELLKTSRNIMVLTGAGVSVSCGIPDFRSEDGIYSRLSEFELDDPQQMFDLRFFKERPEVFFSFAREIFPSNFTPSPSHYFIRLLEKQGQLLRNYTQNIDTLEQKAGIESVLQCHGSFATASCVDCGHQVQGNEIEESIFKQVVAYCKECRTPTPPPTTKAKAKAKKRSKMGYNSDSDEDDENSDEERAKRNRGLMKPDIVFFDQLPHSVPQILINRTPNHMMDFDVQLLGNCDTIVAELCRMAGWELRHEKLPNGTSDLPDMDLHTNADGSGQGGRAAWTFVEPNTYLFDGAVVSKNDFSHIAARIQRVQSSTAHGSLLRSIMSDMESGDNEEEEEDEEGHININNDEDEDEEGSDDNRDQDDGNDRAGSELEEGGRPVKLMNSSRDDVESEIEINDDDDEDHFMSSQGTMHTDRMSVIEMDTATTAVATRIEEGMSEAMRIDAEQIPLSVETTQLNKSGHPMPSGFATGTTEPRSGSISEIHREGSLSSAEAASEESPVKIHGGSGDGEDEEEIRIRVMFTEKMPKDLGEEDVSCPTEDDSLDTVHSSPSHSHGHHHHHHHHHRSPTPPSPGRRGSGAGSSHGRCPSVELVPISEDIQHEVEEEAKEMTDVGTTGEKESMALPTTLERSGDLLLGSTGTAATSQAESSKL